MRPGPPPRPSHAQDNMRVCLRWTQLSGTTQADGEERGGSGTSGRAGQPCLRLRGTGAKGEGTGPPGWDPGRLGGGGGEGPGWEPSSSWHRRQPPAPRVRDTRTASLSSLESPLPAPHPHPELEPPREVLPPPGPAGRSSVPPIQAPGPAPRLGLLRMRVLGREKRGPQPTGARPSLPTAHCGHVQGLVRTDAPPASGRTPLSGNLNSGTRCSQRAGGGGGPQEEQR